MPTVSAVAILAGSIVLGLLVVEILRRALTSRLVSRWPLAPPIVRRCGKPGFAVAFAMGATAGLPPRAVLGAPRPGYGTRFP